MKFLAVIVALSGLCMSLQAKMCMSGMHPTIHQHNKDKGLSGENKVCKSCAMPKFACNCK